MAAFPIFPMQEIKTDPAGKSLAFCFPILERYSSECLKALLSLPGYGNHTKEQLDNTPPQDMVLILNPRPRATFHISWLYTSGCTEAKQLRKLVRQAEIL